MLLSEFLDGPNAPLYHGYKTPKWASLALATGQMVGTTTQRWWEDGKRRKDNDPEYEKSYWMKGVSFTRNFKYAMSWGSIVFVVDRVKLQQKHKLIPFNWGYSMPKGNNHKREQEEFAVTAMRRDRYERSEEDGGGRDMKRFMAPDGSISLNDILMGIYMECSLRKANEYTEKTMIENGYSIEEIIAHPLFKGYYDKNGTTYPPYTDRNSL